MAPELGAQCARRLRDYPLAFRTPQPCTPDVPDQGPPTPATLRAGWSPRAAWRPPVHAGITILNDVVLNQVLVRVRNRSGDVTPAVIATVRKAGVCSGWAGRAGRKSPRCGCRSRREIDRVAPPGVRSRFSVLVRKLCQTRKSRSDPGVEATRNLGAAAAAGVRHPAGAGGLLLTRVLASMLNGVKPTDGGVWGTRRWCCWCRWPPAPSRRGGPAGSIWPWCCATEAEVRGRRVEVGTSGSVVAPGFQEGTTR